MSVPTPKEIREQYADDVSAWKPIRDEARRDMLCVEGHPWESEDPKGKKAREDADRPYLELDELNQYLNQAVNQFRQNKRGIKIEPAGNGATDQTAELRQDLIRGIEYRSKAQQAYVSGFEGAIQRSYGFIGVGRRYKNEEGFDQELYIKRFPNPDAVIIDFNYSDAVASDMKHAFELERIPLKQFQKEHPKAKATDFSSELDMGTYKQWVGEKDIQRAVYWHFRSQPTTLFLVDDGSDSGMLIKKSDFKRLRAHIEDGAVVIPRRKQKKFPILKDRGIEQKSAWQIFTNGLEILDETEFGGPFLGIVPVFGKEMFVDDGSGAERKLISMVRLARSPLMLYCYYRTCEAEAIGMIPKAPMVLYEGQQEGHEDELANLNKLPLPYVLLKPQTDATGQQILPPPGRLPYQPDLQGLELAAEAARRAIQAAMGITPLPTEAQRRNEKSGVALGKIQEEQQIGAFHFADNMDSSLHQVGLILDWHLSRTYDNERDVGLIHEDGIHEVVKINTSEPYPHPKTGEPVQYPTDQGDHEVIISTGPSYQSMREEAAEFAQIVVQNIEALPIPPVQKQKFFALIIKLKNLGPLGDAMVELIDPEQGSAAEQLQQMQQQAMQQQVAMQELTQEVQKLKLEKAGKVIDNEYKLQLAQIQGRFDTLQTQLQNDIKVLTSLITAKNQHNDQEFEMYKTFWTENHKAAHELGMQAQDHAHESDMADKAALNTSLQSAQDAAQNQSQSQV